LRKKKTFAKNLEFQNQKTGFKKEEKKNHLKRQRTNLCDRKWQTKIESNDG
jgi:hypothetical protein